MTYNPKIKNVSSKVTKVDSEYLRADKIYLDLARDPSDTQDTSYEDGLFADFQQANRDSLDSGPEGITIGTAIDRFNEVLSGLAPPPAPKLSTLNSEESEGKEENVAFGGVPELKYNSDPNIATLEDLSQVQDHNVYSKLDSGGHFIRLGMFAEKKQLQIVLNGTVQQNLQGDEENYPANSFNTTNTILPTDLGVQMLDQNDSYANIDPATYNIAIDPDLNDPEYEPRYGMFASGKVFEVFNSSTGIVSLGVDAPWIEGYNRLRVTGTGIETTVVEWVYVPSEHETLGTQYDFTLEQGLEEVFSGTKHISGIQYATDITYSLPAGTNTVNNYAVQSYPQVVDGKELGFWVSTNSSAIPTKTDLGLLEQKSTVVNLVNNKLDISSITVEGAANARTINTDNSVQSPILTFNVKNSFNKTATTTRNASKILFDSYSTENQPLHLTKQKEFENFNNETQRVKSDRSTWDSSLSLGAGDALVFNGSLGHSSRAGDLTDVIRPQSGPDYSTGRTSREYYYRVFQHVSSLSKIWMQFGIDGTVDFTNNVGSGVHVEFSVDNGTNWLDALRLADIEDTGCAAGTLLSTTNNIMEVDFKNAGTGKNNATGEQNIYMRISFPQGSGTITKIDVNYVNVNTGITYNPSLT